MLSLLLQYPMRYAERISVYVQVLCGNQLYTFYIIYYFLPLDRLLYRKSQTEFVYVKKSIW